MRSEKFLRPEMERVLAEEAIEFSRNTCRVVPALTGEQLGDFASIVAACNAQGYIQDGRLDTEVSLESDSISGTDNAENNGHDKAKVHFYSLLKRYPLLDAQSETIWGLYKVLYNCFKSGGKLLLCGNGGSAADCEHIVGELMKGFLLRRPVSEDFASNTALDGEGVLLQGALPAISLTGQPALATAFANDVDAEIVFAQQVYGLGRSGDTLLGVSTSGNAKNVIRALRVARALGLATVGLTGKSGGEMRALCDVCVSVPATETPLIQELHLPIYHTLCAMLEAAFFDE